MNVGDVVELLDETMYNGKWSGRMTVIGVFDPNEVGDDYVKCAHPVMVVSDIACEDLVVMEEANDPQ